MSAHVPALWKITSLIFTVSLLISAGVAYDKQRTIKQAYQAKKIAVLRAESAAQEPRPEEHTASISIDASGFDESAEGGNGCSTIAAARENGFVNCNSVDDATARPRHRISPISDEAEVHVIGVYSDGTVTVEVDYPKRPIVLVLTAYESVKWDIQIHPDTKVERLIISGYHAQSYQGITSSTPVEIYTYDPSKCSTPCWHRQSYFYAYDLVDAQKKLDPRIEGIIGKRMSSFQGAYTGTSFNIHNRIQQLND